ncbi:MAG: DUF4230 domain-containing protein [Bacteroidota bacterium]
MFADEIKWLIGMLLVVAVMALGIIFFVPKGFFGKLFGSEKVTIAESPLSIKEINGIGELISAEFYGEVIHPLVRGNKAENSDDLQKYYDALYNQIQELYDENNIPRGLFNKKLDPKKTWNKVMNALEHLPIHESENFQGIKQIAGMEFSDDLAFAKFVKINNWDAFRRDPARQRGIDNFFAKSRSLNELQQREALEFELELTYLGRGWVKAGYRLGQLQEEQLVRQNDTLYIKNVNPEILNADINPWFIPPTKGYKNGSPGFELLRARINGKDVENLDTGSGSRNDQKRRIPFWAIDDAKKETKFQLLKEAFERHILDSARVSAERSLLQLFQLVEPDSALQLAAVKLVPTPLYSFGQELTADAYCLSRVDVDSLQARYARDTEASENEDTSVEVRKAQWQKFVKELDGLLLCRKNYPSWYDFKENVLN